MTDYRALARDIASTWFWEIIATAHSREERLYQVLSGASADEIAWFHDQFVTASAELRSQPGFEERFGADSEDHIDDVADFVISSGIEAYAAALETLPPEDLAVPDGGILAGVAVQLYMDRFGVLLEGY